MTDAQNPQTLSLGGAVEPAPDLPAVRHVQLPTVGRIVHYQPLNPDWPPYAAIVTAVVGEPDDLTVGLEIFTPRWMPEDMVDEYRPHVHSYAETPTPGCWSWPPRTTEGK